MERNTITKILTEKCGKKRATLYEKKIFDLATKEEEDYNTLAYDIIGRLFVDDVDVVLKDIDEGKIGWMSSNYEEYRKNKDKQYDKRLFKPSTVKGVYICKDPACKSDEFFVYSRQTRSSDESMSVFRQCAKCGKRGKE